MSGKKKLLLHCCCAPCTCGVLDRLDSLIFNFLCFGILYMVVMTL